MATGHVGVQLKHLQYYQGFSADAYGPETVGELKGYPSPESLIFLYVLMRPSFGALLQFIGLMLGSINPSSGCPLAVLIVAT